MKSESIAELAKALVAVQEEMPKLKKTADNPFFKSKYVDLATVMESMLPILSKNGLAITQFVSNIDGQSSLTTTLIHTSGEFMSATMPLLLPKNDPQGQGSAITYARRYGAMSALGIVADEDDDGNKAARSYQQSQVTAYPKPPTRKEREAKITPLDEKRSEIIHEFWNGGITDHKEMKAFIRKEIGKEQVTNEEEADRVLEVLTSLTGEIK